MLILLLLLLSSSFVMWCQCFARINDLCGWVDFRNKESVICWSVTGQNLWQQRWRIPVLKPTRVTHILTKYWYDLGAASAVEAGLSARQTPRLVQRGIPSRGCPLVSCLAECSANEPWSRRGSYRLSIAMPQAVYRTPMSSVVTAVIVGIFISL